MPEFGLSSRIPQIKKRSTRKKLKEGKGGLWIRRAKGVEIV
jgi:hypothetical protein